MGILVLALERRNIFFTPLSFPMNRFGLDCHMEAILKYGEWNELDFRTMEGVPAPPGTK